MRKSGGSVGLGRVWNGTQDAATLGVEGIGWRLAWNAKPGLEGDV